LQQPVAIAVVRRPLGVKGDLLLEDYTDGAYAPAGGQEVVLLGPGAEMATVVRSWERRGAEVVAHLDCAEDRNAAEGYRGWRVAVDRDDLPPAGDDAYYAFELVGLAVETTAGEAAGQVEAVYSVGPHDVLTIRDGERTYEVPFVRAHVAAVIPGRKVVVVPYREA